MKAVITAAGKQHRHLPLQTMADAKGSPKSILGMQFQDLRDAGVNKVGMIVHPGDEVLFQEAARESNDFVEFIPQEHPAGYGHAILCARDFVGDEPFLLSVGDHFFVSDDPEKNCFHQVIEASRRMEASVSAVQATHESSIQRFGTIAGEWIDDDRRMLRVREVVEKPTPTLAEQRLIVSGLRAGLYLSFFGIHVLHPSVFGHLDALLSETDHPLKITLTDAVNRMIGEENYHAIEVAGRRFDLEAPFGLLHGQLALALKSPAREQILDDLLRLVAER